MKRFKHNLSHYKLLTAEMGKLYPVGCVEVLPGDSFKHQTDVMIRMSPLAAPTMHPVTARIHHFYIPNRLTWPTFEDFITGGPDGNNSDTIPTKTSSNSRICDLLYGINIGGLDVNALPLWAFNTVWNEYYRDQDLQSEAATGVFTEHKIAWEKDYFTTARPWETKGDAVTLPVGSEAPVTGLGVSVAPTAGPSGTINETGPTSQTYANYYQTNAAGMWLEDDPSNTGYPNLKADLSAATAIGLQDFREALALQRYQEARARYGSRYTEYLAYLGIRSSDARLQRPEFLGGGRSQVNFSEVLQTGPETGTNPTNAFGVGDMYGHGVAALRSNGYKKFFEEHGFVISCLSVRPKAIYANGIHRSMLRTDKEDYFQKELQFVGQQEIYDNEIYADAANTKQDVFGYQDRYSEYRSQPSTVHGDFRTTLDHWHQARLLGSAPTLNSDFIECEPTKRIHNVTTGDTMWIAVNHRIAARRLVSRNATPRII